MPLAQPRAEADKKRLEAMFAQHFDFIWRSLRRLGLREDRADDAAQQVFIVASEKLDSIHPGSERSFLFGTALRVASDVRRSAPFRKEIAEADPARDVEGGVRPDEVLDQRRARDLLDRALEVLESDLRVVFILFELEELTMGEIATLLEIPAGTVASRLRRARAEFKGAVTRLQARKAPVGGAP
jgi:RNA polymerase sigma-70 factor (ECF subfamily)